jgi:Fe-S cluster biosynthesis and repair protein YggX
MLNNQLLSLPLSSSRKDDNELNNINPNIFRFKFTDDFTCELFKFSKIHQYDHRKDFKEAWNIWVEHNEMLVEDEMRRLINLGYGGNIKDKMFKSARYYFRKKSTEKKEPIKRRDYVGVNKVLLDAMDDHIRNKMKETNFKPSDSFDEFCKIHINVIKEEVLNLCKSGITNSTEIKDKFKKTYKNRYFLVISK